MSSEYQAVLCILAVAPADASQQGQSTPAQRASVVACLGGGEQRHVTFANPRTLEPRSTSCSTPYRLSKKVRG